MSIKKIHINKEYEPIEFKKPKPKRKKYSPTWYMNSSLRQRNLMKSKKKGELR